MSELVILQSQFFLAVCSWGQKVAEHGYRLTFGDAYDTDGDGGHMKNSNHHQRLALDVNLFVCNHNTGKWDYITKSDHPAWLVCGALWKEMHQLARWGGDFAKRDANHISFEHNGVK